MTKYQSFLLKRWEHFDWIRRILLQREFRRDYDFFRACIEEWCRNPPPGSLIDDFSLIREQRARLQHLRAFEPVISREELKATYENTKKSVN